MKKIIINPGYNNIIIMNLAKNKFLEYRSMNKIETTIIDDNTDELKDLAETKYK